MLRLKPKNTIQEQEAIPPTHKRLSILGEDEIEALYGRPRFTAEERMHYFSLSQPEKALLEELRSVKSQAYGKARQQLTAKARQAARVSGQPVYIFRELLQYLAEQRIVAPGYSFLQDTVGKALTAEQHRLRTLG